MPLLKLLDCRLPAAVPALHRGDALSGDETPAKGNFRGRYVINSVEFTFTSIVIFGPLLMLEIVPS